MNLFPVNTVLESVVTNVFRNKETPRLVGVKGKQKPQTRNSHSWSGAFPSRPLPLSWTNCVKPTNQPTWVLVSSSTKSKGKTSWSLRDTSIPKILPFFWQILWANDMLSTVGHVKNHKQTRRSCWQKTRTKKIMQRRKSHDRTAEYNKGLK